MLNYLGDSWWSAALPGTPGRGTKRNRGNAGERRRRRRRQDQKRREEFSARKILLELADETVAGLGRPLRLRLAAAIGLGTTGGRGRILRNISVTMDRIPGSAVGKKEKQYIAQHSRRASAS